MSMIETIQTKLAGHTFDHPPPLQRFDGPISFWGKRGALGYIVTQDHDGQIEISLGGADQRRRRPSNAECRAFFIWLGIKPISKTRTRLSQHFVMIAGGADT